MAAQPLTPSLSAWSWQGSPCACRDPSCLPAAHRDRGCGSFVGCKRSLGLPALSGTSLPLFLGALLTVGVAVVFQIFLVLLHLVLSLFVVIILTVVLAACFGAVVIRRCFGFGFPCKSFYSVNRKSRAAQGVTTPTRAEGEAHHSIPPATSPHEPFGLTPAPREGCPALQRLSPSSARGFHHANQRQETPKRVPGEQHLELSPVCLPSLPTCPGSCLLTSQPSLPGFFAPADPCCSLSRVWSHQ